MNDYCITVDYDMGINEDLNYSSIIFAPLPVPEDINQAIGNLSKHIDWAIDSKNDIRGQNNSIIQGSQIILKWKDNNKYQFKLKKLLNDDSKKSVYDKMLDLYKKKNN